MQMVEVSFRPVEISTGLLLYSRTQSFIHVLEVRLSRTHTHAQHTHTHTQNTSLVPRLIPDEPGNEANKTPVALAEPSFVVWFKHLFFSY